MKRGDLNDAEWARLQPMLPPQRPKVGRPAKDHRQVVDGILWILRTGAPWRDLPEHYGKWKTVNSRFYRWRAAGVWERLLGALQEQADAAGRLDWDKHYAYSFRGPRRDQAVRTRHPPRACDPDSMRPRGVDPQRSGPNW